jgi:hypothetical protein
MAEDLVPSLPQERRLAIRIAGVVRGRRFVSYPGAVAVGVS